MSILSLVCWIAWIFVLSYLDPVESGALSHVLFYLSLFLALMGTFSLLGFFGRVWFSKEEVIFRHLGVSFRQAILFALFLTGLLMLQGVRFLRWWNVLLFMILLTIAEFLFLSKRPYRQLPNAS